MNFHAPLFLSLLILSLTIIFVWQNDSLAQAPEKDLTAAAANFKAEEFVNAETATEINLNRALQTNEKIGLTIERTDVSNLFRQTDNRFIYAAKLLPLPLGNSILTVFLIFRYHAVGSKRTENL